jgi:hypothetical protein
MRNLWNTAFTDEKGRLKQGHEYHTLLNMYDRKEIGLILRWRNGKLQDDGELPAVEFEDTHIEHYRNGLLHYDSTDDAGKLKPAIISDYATKTEYYINGMKLKY